VRFVYSFKQGDLFLVDVLKRQLRSLQHGNRVLQNFISLNLRSTDQHLIDVQLFLLFDGLKLMFRGDFCLLFDVFDQVLDLFFLLIDLDLLDFKFLL